MALSFHVLVGFLYINFLVIKVIHTHYKYTLKNIAIKEKCVILPSGESQFCGSSFVKNISLLSVYICLCKCVCMSKQNSTLYREHFHMPLKILWNYL